MLALIATALAASTPPAAATARPASATVRATASVRILSSASIHWGESAAALPKLRQTHFRGPSGELEPIRLIEFE